MGRWRLAGLLFVLAAAAGAAPDDDHARGLQAYQRGDVVAAMTALRAGARAGHAPSMVLLAFILDRSDASDEAFALYRDAAAAGNADAEAGLADLYLSGRGVAKDENAAYAHFSKAADAGHALAIEVVASAVLQGRPVGDAEAAAALRRAAANQHLPSIEALAAASESGRFGIAPDPQQAALWRSRAAELRRLRAARPLR